MITGRTNTSLYLYVLAKNLDTEEIGLYGYNFVTKEPITNFPANNYLSCVSNKINVFDTYGNYSDMLGLDYVIKEQEINIKFKQDLNTLKDNEDILRDILRGKVFDTNKLTLGSTGNIINGTFSNNNPFGNLFYYELKNLRSPTTYDDFGYSKKIKNTQFDCIENKQKPFILESLTSKGTLIENTFIPAVTTEDKVLDEGDINVYNLKLRRYCDNHSKSDSIISNSENKLSLDYILNPIIIPTNNEGTIDFGDGYVLTLSEYSDTNIDIYLKENVGEVEVDYIVLSDNLPYNASEGEEILLINTDGKSFLLKYYNSDWCLISTGQLGENYRVFSRNYCTTNNLSNSINHHCFASINNVETDIEGLSLYGNADLYGNTFICKIYMYNRYSQEFENYIEED